MAPPERKIYVRPIGLAENPQSYNGATIRLGNSLVWCHQLALEFTENGRIAERRLVSVADWDTALSDLSDTHAAHAQILFSNLRATHAPLQLGERTIRFDQPQVMGILNMTPDSFSDGGQFADDAEKAADAGFAMIQAGAAIVDVGGESTKPGATPVWEGDEVKRVVPVIERLARSSAIVSADTRKAAVMEAALAAGAHIINDISGLLYDDRAVAVLREADCPLVIMHAPSQGDDPHQNTGYSNIATEVFDWLEARISALIEQGIRRQNIIADPGIGFGKTLADSLSIINNLPLYHGLGVPLLFGASRKRIIGALSNEAPASDRLGGSVALAMKAIDAGVQIVRVHDVPETVQACRVWRGLRDAALTVPGLE